MPLDGIPDSPPRLTVSPAQAFLAQVQTVNLSGSYGGTAPIEIHSLNIFGEKRLRCRVAQAQRRDTTPWEAPALATKTMDRAPVPL
jgi:hypothetical protein